MKKTNNNKKQPSFKITLSNPTAFRKSFLKNGWVILTKNGQWFTVEKIQGYGTAFVSRSKKEVRPAIQWRADLTSKNNPDEDIVLAAQPSEMQDYIEERFEEYVVVYDASEKKSTLPTRTVGEVKLKVLKKEKKNGKNEEKGA